VKIKDFVVATILLVALLAIYYGNTPVKKNHDTGNVASSPKLPQASQSHHKPSPIVPVSPIVKAARSQIGKTVSYNPAYAGLDYPNGDIPIEKGVCSDVVIRALRDGLDMDLQKLVHEDMRIAFSEYPDIWRLTRPDRNIDHRRVPNLKTYFKRHGYQVAVTDNKQDYLEGDLVTCTVGRSAPHIMIVSNRKGPNGTLMVIHNIGIGTKEENRLFEFPLTGHYRIKSNRPN
jgi:uncharacterized protein YijF (DUF1287 family)